MGSRWIFATLVESGRVRLRSGNWLSSEDGLDEDVEEEDGSFP